MANQVLLDNITHKDLKIDIGRSTRCGDNVTCTVIFPIEFRQIQSEYPIVFGKDAETGQFEPLAMFGLAENENLFLTDKGWNAGYIPLTLERQPFLIGFQTATVDGVDTEEPVVYIDMDSPRISQTEGQPVFLEHGGSSPYLEHINWNMYKACMGGMPGKGVDDAAHNLGYGWEHRESSNTGYAACRWTYAKLLAGSTRICFG